MLDNHQANEDLKAFERRLTEIIACYQPQTKRWRIILLIATLTTSISAFHWLFDPQTDDSTLVESLHNHIFFTFNCIFLIVLFLFGIHRKVVAPAIIVSRIRTVLENFNMSCDHEGRLILKRATSTLQSSLSSSSATLLSSHQSSASPSPSSPNISTSTASSGMASAYNNISNNHPMQCLPTIGRT